MPVAPVQNVLAKTMLTHIGIALTLGGAAAAAFWTQHVIPNREIRAAYYKKYNAERSA
ncbi:hypothetical protein BGW42_007346 [Actinomortierella wolfii]|nr:hypothetical protein BGW42_007346 [Actinomortierella wolfii]